MQMFIELFLAIFQDMLAPFSYDSIHKIPNRGFLKEIF